MNESPTYSVVLSGKIKSGFEIEAVVDAFSTLFKLPPEKAKALVGKKFVMKKGVELKLAKTYKDKLSAIGVDAVLKRQGGLDGLSLEPIQNPEAEEVTPDQKDSNVESPRPLPADAMVCPKCNLQQSKAEECHGCGVLVQKFLSKTTEPRIEKEFAQAVDSKPSTAEFLDDSDEKNPKGFKAFMAPAAVAGLGALLWYFIAESFDFEFGLIAWLIGGAIGFAAAMSGARGQMAGIVCGALVIFSICGGKYLTIANYQSSLAEALSTSETYEGTDLRELYEEEKADAQIFVKLSDDDTSLRQFIVDRGYSDAIDTSEVSDEHLEEFREYTQPRLEDIAINRPDFEEWRQYSLTTGIEDLSTIELVINGLDWKDILFLFFGIATAYRLVNRDS